MKSCLMPPPPYKIKTYLFKVLFIYYYFSKSCVDATCSGSPPAWLRITKKIIIFSKVQMGYFLNLKVKNN